MIHLLSLIAALLPTYLVRFEVFGIPSTLLEVVIYLTFVIGVWQFGRDRHVWERLWSRRVWLWPAGLMLLGATIGLFVASDLRVALGLWKGFILDPILVYLILLTFVGSLRQLQSILGGLLLGGALVAIWGIVEAVTGGSVDRVIGPYDLDADASPNYLAFALAPLVPLAVWLGLERKRWQFWVLVVILLVAIASTESRAGLAAAVGGGFLALVLSLQSFWRSKVARGVLVVGLLLALAGSWFVVRPDFSLTDDGSRTVTSNNVRWQLWSATGELARQNPILGTGLGNFQTAFGELTEGRVNFPEFITPRARTPHNLIVGIWMELGLIGLIGLIGAIVLVGKVLFEALRLRSGQSAPAALIGSWFVLLAHGLVDMPIWKNDSMILFWILVAASAVISRQSLIANR